MLFIHYRPSWMAFARGDTENVSRPFAFFSSCSPRMPFHIGSGVGLRCRHFWIETRSLKQLSTLLLSRFSLARPLSFLLSFFRSLVLTLSFLLSPSLSLSLILSPKRKQKTGMWCTILGGMDWEFEREMSKTCSVLFAQRISRNHNYLPCVNARFIL